MTDLKTDLYFTRKFKVAIDQLCARNESQMISKVDLDTLYQKIIGIMDTKLKANLPELSVPNVEVVTVGPNNTPLHVNKPTQLIFNKTAEGEWIATGKLLDEVKEICLSFDDLLLCVSNGWRFVIESCVPELKHFTDSPYAIAKELVVFPMPAKK